MRHLELLAPAGNAGIAFEAILHGADAVYMGATSHGARQNASNSIEDIKRVVDFAHIYRAKVYVTVNTIVYEKELIAVEKLISQLYYIGVDAIIVQDMGILRMDIPPIELHASTQCDIRTPEKALFLQEVGFSQLVLPRELTLKEISRIAETVKVPVECFVHGALCVSYSGRCHASQALCRRSANRGECSQVCRLPYSLKDADGRLITQDKHLLSLRDFNMLDGLAQLVEAGASSFKIEGRLKEAAYVKNVVAAYRKELDLIIQSNPKEYSSSSFGRPEISFTPSPSKSFNRGFTHYFTLERRPRSIASLNTPKSMGEKIPDISMLRNGDGISYFDAEGNYTGTIVNGIEGGRIITHKHSTIPKGAELHRTFDRIWEKQLARPTAERKLNISIAIGLTGATASDERGNLVRLPLECKIEKAEKEMNFESYFGKLGNTPYRLESFKSELPPMTFIPATDLTKLKRRLITALDTANAVTYPYSYRSPENSGIPYMTDCLDFRDNVANSLAEEFYRQHGVKVIERAMETSKREPVKGTRVMTTRYCILRELGMCKKEKGLGNYAEPLTLTSSKANYELEFNCKDCEMHLLTSGVNQKSHF